MRKFRPSAAVFASISLAALLIGAGGPSFGQDQSRAEQALRQIDPKPVEQILRKNFSPRDIEELASYFRQRLAGKPAFLDPELRRRFEQAMGEFRLEYGFQMAILLSELRKAADEYGIELGPLEKELDGAQ